MPRVVVDRWSEEEDWTCSHCRQEVPGRHQTCAMCGARRGQEAFHARPDAPRIGADSPPELQHLATLGADRTCPYCHKAIRADRDECDPCGAQRDEEADAAPEAPVAASPPAPPARPAIRPPPPDGDDEAPLPMSRPAWLLPGVFALGIVLVIVPLWTLFRAHEEQGTVREVSWQYGLVVSHREPRATGGFRHEAPSGAFGFTGCAAREHDGHQCGRHECGTEEYECGRDPCGTETYACGTETWNCSNDCTSNGNGTRSCTRSCDTRDRICTREKTCPRLCQRPRYCPTWCDCEHCSYNVWDWRSDDERVAVGRSLAPSWPVAPGVRAAVPPALPRPTDPSWTRVQATASHRVVFTTGTRRDYATGSLDEFRRYAIGSRWTLQVNLFGITGTPRAR
jgi:hypothetical protein